MPANDKTAIFNIYKKAKTKEDIAVGLNSFELSSSIRNALYEITFS
jgi:hypothetical protein